MTCADVVFPRLFVYHEVFVISLGPLTSVSVGKYTIYLTLMSFVLAVCRLSSMKNLFNFCIH